MKRITLLTISVLLAQMAWSQTRPWENLKNVEGTYYVESEGKDYQVNSSVVTVKFKNGIIKSKIPLDTLIANQLGYINIAVPENWDLVAFLDSLLYSKDFSSIEYNTFGEFLSSGYIPNDPQLISQWYLDAVNAFDAWNITTGLPSVKLAVIDAGPNWSHSDIGLGSDGYTNVDTSLAWDFIDSTNIMPEYEHGTRILGQIGGKTNNGTGIAGIAGGNGISQGVTIIPINIGYYDSTKRGVVADGSHLANAIIDAVNKGAKIIQLSLGFVRTFPKNDSEDSTKSAIDAAIAYAVQNCVLIVCAAGNGSSSDPTCGVAYPASHPDVMAVGAINQDHKRWLFSCYGYALDVVAPGVDIWSTTVDNNYDNQNGTSFAAPIVSGIAALMLSANPSLNCQDARNIIVRSAQKVRTDLYIYQDTACKPTISDIPDSTICDTIIYPNGAFYIEMGYGSVDAYASVLLAARGINDSCLFIRDTPEDIGIEPNIAQEITNSPDIWVRRANDGGKIHQDPCSADTNYIYVRVRNAGWQSTAGGETLRVYWNGNAYSTPIATFPIISLRPGRDTVFVLPWLFPNAVTASNVNILAAIDTVLTVPPVLVEDLARNSHKIAMKNITLSQGFDLMIADSHTDLGEEPFFNFYTEPFSSPNIWTRQQADTGLLPQNPIPDSLNYIYVKINNIGCAASTVNDTLKLYWAKTDTNLSWASNWETNLIASKPLPSILSGKESIIEIPWQNIPNLLNYRYISENPWDFHLLARIVSANDPMTFSETADVLQNIQNNNNIAGTSLTIGYYDLTIRDDTNDSGKEPNPTPSLDPDLWVSPDIWVRRKPDSIEQHQDFKLMNDFAYVYVRVKNIGTAFSRGGEQLHLYWAKEPTDVWDGINQTINTQWKEIYPLNQDGSAYDANLIHYLPSLLSGEEIIMEIPWIVPTTQASYFTDGLMLLARIISDRDTMTFFEERAVATNVRNNNNIAWRKVYANVCSENLDLMLRDDAADVGIEPNYAGNMFNSPDIWVRRNRDDSVTHQNPIPNQTNYVYIRINKIGGISQVNEKLKLYWAKEGSSLSWDSCWKDGNTFPDGITPLGGFIDSATIFSDKPCGNDIIISIPWTAPDYRNYCGIPTNPNLPIGLNNPAINPYGFYLLARIESAQDTMTFPETTNLNNNIRNNNNIAAKLVTLARNDLMVRDTLTDIGIEPSTCSIISNSPDISTQEPGGRSALRARKETEVNVKITNTGCTQSQGNEILKLYWRKTEDNMVWDTNRHLIKDTIIPSIASKGEKTVTIPWIPQDPSNYTNSNNPNLFSLLAVIEEDGFVQPAESEAIDSIVQNNKNIALNNVHVCGGFNLVIRDNEEDDGTQSTTGNTWNSSDMWLSNGYLILGGYNHIYFRIKNTGECIYYDKDSASISFYWAKTKSNMHDTDWHLIQTKPISGIEPGDVTFLSAIQWKPPVPDSAFYLLAVITEDKKHPVTPPTGSISDIDSLIRNNKLIAGKYVFAQGVIDLMVRDCPADVGIVPNTCPSTWESEDIWVRRNRGGQDSLTPQNPLGNSTNWVYVRITNCGKVPSSGREKLHLHWSKAGTNLGWSQAWDGTEFFKNTAPPVPVGGKIDSIIIPSLQPGKDIILSIRWDVPNPEHYQGIDGIDEPWHFCLLARIISPETDPMTDEETESIWYNIQKNNNIAMRNVSIIDLGTGYDPIGSTIFIANWSGMSHAYSLRFNPKENAVTLHQEAEITVKLSDKLYLAWKQGGKIGQEIEEKDSNTFLIKGDNARLSNLILEPGEIGLLSLTVNFLTRGKNEMKLEYDFHVTQIDKYDEVIGGEVYHVITPPRKMFYANAEDVYAFQNDPVVLTATDIGEPAIYRWYDKDKGNLLCEGQNFFTVAVSQTTYKLEVIALSDGYKDYDEVAVKIVPGKIEELFPNPISDQLNVTYVFNNVTDVSLQITNYLGIIYEEVQLDINSSGKTAVFDTFTYPIGTYVVSLFCDKKIVCTKTFVKK